MDVAQKILAKGPPADLDKNVKAFSELLKKNPDAKEKFLKLYPMPFATYQPTEEEEEDGEKAFIMCRHNRVGDKHRSPWTQELYPKPQGWKKKAKPAPAKKGGGSGIRIVSTEVSSATEEDELLLQIEAKFNVVWSAYTALYYGHDAVSSVFLSETEKKELVGFFAIQKKCDEGSWNSMHFMSMEPATSKDCTYRIISHVLIELKPDINGKECTTIDLSAALTKDTTKTLKIVPAFIMSSHIENIGTILESNEIDLRSNLERVHIPNIAELTDAIQKEPEAPKVANPLAAMMMSSDILKKKKKVDA